MARNRPMDRKPVSETSQLLQFRDSLRVSKNIVPNFLVQQGLRDFLGTGETA